MKKKSILKRLILLTIVIAAFFAIINLVWYVGIWMKYDRIIEKLEPIMVMEEGELEAAAAEDDETERTGHYKGVADGYIFLVKATHYLQTDGFVTCAPEKEYSWREDDEGNVIWDNGPYVGMYIWPQVIGYKYGLIIFDADIDMHIYIDQNGQYIPENKKNIEYNEYMEEILAKYENEINQVRNMVDTYLELN